MSGVKQPTGSFSGSSTNPTLAADGERSGGAARPASRKRRAGPPKTSDSIAVPPPAAWFQNGFQRFLERYLRRHFHAIAIAREGHPRDQFAALSRQTGETNPLQDPDLPMLVYSNHPGWWDPLIAQFANHRLFMPRQFYAPIDAEALQQYRVFEKLGFFGVEPHTSRGAASFLRVTSELFQRPHTALWMTPEGRFADPRDHEAELMPGLAHVCTRLTSGWIVPMALEYVFWEERLPECLMKVGECVSLKEYPDRDKAAWAADLQHRLRQVQSQLSRLAIARRSEPFENLLQGKQGARGVYDMARRVKSLVTGRRFQAAHGDQFR